MASIAGTTRRAIQSWTLFPTSRCSNQTYNTGQHLSRISVREIRTKAVTLRRRPIPTATSQIGSEGTLKEPAHIINSLPTTKQPEPIAVAVPEIERAQGASSTRRIQRGFPASFDSDSRSKPRAIKVVVSKPSTTIKSSELLSTKQEVQEPLAKPEKFPRKLQAFPFVPGATTSELSKAHKFFLLPAEFVKSATSLSMIPENTAIPEVVFIGRSNIGKSSLINGLVNRNGLVKTSSKPGHTRMMNFFRIGEKLSLVDMPGYGWKSRDEWGGMILSYLQNRKNLRRIYILVDPSHGLKESDTQIMKLLDGSGLSYQVVLTKMDRLSKTKYGAARAEIEAHLVKGAICCFPLVLGVSSKTRDGLDELRAAIIKAGQLSL